MDQVVASVPHAPYAYLLGQYLGDGCISELARTTRLRIAVTWDYQGIVAEIVEAITACMSGNAVAVRRIGETGGGEVGCYSCLWPVLFPQHAAGRKHERAIVLEPWQREITTAQPEAFIRGPIHSDGCRYVNRVRAHGRWYSYPSYCFTNHSVDILVLFTDHLDLLGIGWRQQTWKTIAITRRADVAGLDEFVGPKR